MNTDKQYRLVADYGYGDKTWVSRFLTEHQAILEYKLMSGCDDLPTLEHAMASEGAYRIEEDNDDDVEDWDWQDS